MATSDAIEMSDEIDSIMNEIEELQKEMTSEPAPKAAAPTPPAAPASSEAPVDVAVAAAAAAIAEPAPQAAASPEAQAEVPTDAPVEETVDDILSEIQASAPPAGSDTALEETLSQLKTEAAHGGLLEEPAETPTQEPVVPAAHAQVPTAVTREETMPKAEQGNDGTLSLTLSGNMTLKLKYEFEGQEVTISFADQALRVQMTDGTEFKVPVARAQASNVKPFKKAV